MTAEQLREAVNKIDDELIAEAEHFEIEEKTISKPVLMLVPAVASVFVCLGLGYFTKLENSGGDFETDINIVSGTVSYISTEKYFAENTASEYSSCSTSFYTVPSAVTISENTVITENLHTGTDVNISDTSSAENTGYISKTVPDTNVIISQTASTEEISSAVLESMTAHTEEITDITETSVTNISENVSKVPDDIFEKVINSFGENAIVLDYTKTGNALREAMVMTESGSCCYFNEGEPYSHVLMKDEKAPQTEKIKEALGNDELCFWGEENSYKFYVNGKPYKNTVYDILRNDENVLSIDEISYVDSRDFNIWGICINSDDDKETIVKKYPALKLKESSGAHINIYKEKYRYCFECSYSRNEDTYNALKQLSDDGTEYIFNIEVSESFGEWHYAQDTVNVYRSLNN